MISVSEARARMLAAAGVLPTEQVSLRDAVGRVLAEPLRALRDQPPQDVSAMDGYAVRGGDVAAAPITLRVIGTSAAGHGYKGAPLKAAEAVRIFTGAPVPAGADTVVIQEDVENVGAASVVLRMPATGGANVRRRGDDFSNQVELLPADRRLDASAVALAAASGHVSVSVRRKPRVAVLATGDELVPPGVVPQPGQIISSNGVGLCALIESAGGVARDLGIAVDKAEAIAAAAREAKGADILVTIGGASVGDHDLVRPVLEAEGITIDFWKIAMRPGKPVMFGRDRDGMLFLGLPGNPVSALVCAILYLRPLILASLGLPTALPERMMPLATPLAANDKREDYLRAAFVGDAVKPFSQQSSGQLSRLAQADGLIRRPPGAEAASAGSLVPVLPLELLW